MLVLNREQSRRVDRVAIERFHIPGIVLMENAARGAADEILRLLGRKGGRGHPPHPTGWGRLARRVAVVCGGGNNGGDGYAIARHLHIAGIGVTVYAASDPEALKGDAKINRDTLGRTRVEIRRVLTARQLAKARTEWAAADVLVDALLGTGLTGPGEVRPELAAVIRVIERARQGQNSPQRTKRTQSTQRTAFKNEKAFSAASALFAVKDQRRTGPMVFAIDVPSGLDCDTGLPCGTAVRADVTATFVALKPGFLKECARTYLGRVVVLGIGAPPEVVESVIRGS